MCCMVCDDRHECHTRDLARENRAMSAPNVKKVPIVLRVRAQSVLQFRAMSSNEVTLLKSLCEE